MTSDNEELAQLLAEASATARMLAEAAGTDETKLWSGRLARRIDRYRAQQGWLEPAAAAALTEQSRREWEEFLAMFPPGTPEQEAEAKAWAHNVIYGNESQL